MLWKDKGEPAIFRDVCGIEDFLDRRTQVIVSFFTKKAKASIGRGLHPEPEGTKPNL
jgi:hypothetical protein